MKNISYLDLFTDFKDINFDEIPELIIVDEKFEIKES
jgi:hypothetical protein